MKIKWHLVGFFFLLLFLSMVVVMLYGLFFDNHNGGRVVDYLIILFFLIIGTLITIHIGLWQINGKDIISYNECYLTVCSKGAIFHLKPKVFRFEVNLRVERLERDKLGFERNRMVLKGIEGDWKFGYCLNNRSISLWLSKLNNLIIERTK